MVRVSARFELTRVRVIGSQLYKFDVELGLRARKVSNECGLTILRNRTIEKMLTFNLTVADVTPFIT